MDRLSELLNHAYARGKQYQLELWVEMYHEAMGRMRKLHDREQRSGNTIRDQKLLAIERLEMEIVLLNLQDLEREIKQDP